MIIKKIKNNFGKIFTQKLIISIGFFLCYYFLSIQIGWINKIKEITHLFIMTMWWGIFGGLIGAITYGLFKNKGKIIIDNTSEFLDLCKNSNGMVFFGPIGSGKTAILAMLAHELPGENKYASFPCNLPWMERAQIDFSSAPSKTLGVTEFIFLDEINLLFKGNIVQDVREKQRFLMHFIALSRQQGTIIFANGQRLGQFSIEQHEITTAVCQVQRLQKIDEGIYTKCVIWESAGWGNQRTEREFIIFIPRKYLDTYNSYWLKSLKYLRDNQGYI
jgi:hypothetical protein